MTIIDLATCKWCCYLVFPVLFHNSLYASRVQLVWDERLVTVLGYTELIYLTHFPGHIGCIVFFQKDMVLFYFMTDNFLLSNFNFMK